MTKLHVRTRAITVLWSIPPCPRAPTRRAAASRAASSIPPLMSAARVGPVVYGLLLTFRGDGYG